MECQKKRKKEIYFSSSSFCKERETIPASKNIKRKTFRRWLFEFQTLRLLWLLLEGDNMFLFFFLLYAGQQQPASPGVTM
jgi:hypothetical protein